MTIHSAIVPPDAAATPMAGASLVTAVVRRWRSARDRGLPAQQRLHAILAPRGWDMLTPAFDSLMTVWEHALGRPLATGSDPGLSRDERMLLDLLDGSARRDARVTCPAPVARMLDAAIRSTRVLIRRTPAGSRW